MSVNNCSAIGFPCVEELKKVGEVETAVGDVGSPEAGSPEAR